MAEVIWTQTALNELDELINALALTNSGEAGKLVRRIFERTDKLSRLPSLGRTSPEIKATPYLRVVVDPALLYYRLDGDRVLVLLVKRGADLFHVARPKTGLVRL